ncbi:MAG TPA: hypothetical protein VHJ39_05025 [Solirubrobacteraceae bacterium]|jgi:hypothetical protein|nr:hypothetical protein [Solirubrobacteraceae bacterium]
MSFSSTSTFGCRRTPGACARSPSRRRIGSSSADFVEDQRRGGELLDRVAIALLIAVSALLLVVLDRQLREQEPPEDDDPAER